MRSVVAAAALLITASQAYCQTAEETMNYLLFGYEGEPIDTKIGDMTFSYKPDPEKDESILMHAYGSFGKNNYNLDVYTAKISSDSGCNYTIEGRMANMMIYKPGNSINYFSYHLYYDFSNANQLILHNKDQDPSVEMTGVKISCTAGNTEFCKHNGRGAFINVGNEERLQKAWSYFKQTYCKGKTSAF